jgi:hypothetical protein
MQEGERIEITDGKKMQEGERIEIIDGKKMKVVVKEVHDRGTACEMCRARKRKCDGQLPCSYIS